MVKTSLVEADLLTGWKLLTTLYSPPHKALFRVKAAFWFYYAASEDWRLVLASPLVDERGPLETYSRLQELLFEFQSSDLDLQNTAVISPGDRIVKALRREMQIVTWSPYFRFTGSALGGTYIEDAYVYKLPPPQNWSPERIRRVRGSEERDGRAHAQRER